MRSSPLGLAALLWLSSACGDDEAPIADAGADRDSNVLDGTDGGVEPDANDGSDDAGADAGGFPCAKDEAWCNGVCVGATKPEGGGCRFVARLGGVHASTADESAAYFATSGVPATMFGSPVYALWRISHPSGELTKLYDGYVDARFLQATGSHLWFATDSVGLTYDIARIAKSNGAKETVIEGLHKVKQLRVTSEAIFVAATRDDSPGLYRFPLEGGEPTQLVFEEIADFRLEGDTILYTAQEMYVGGDLKAVPLAGGSPVILVEGQYSAIHAVHAGQVFMSGVGLIYRAPLAGGMRVAWLNWDGFGREEGKIPNIRSIYSVRQIGDAMYWLTEFADRRGFQITRSELRDAPAQPEALGFSESSFFVSHGFERVGRTTYLPTVYGAPDADTFILAVSDSEP